MLKPAQLYEEQLQQKNIESWYKPENIFWHGDAGEYMIELPDNNCKYHKFVSIDKNDDVIGYISYSVDWVSMSADNFGIISFEKNSVEFAKDLYRAVCDLFEVYHMNRISWSVYTDNPAIRGYRNFIKKHGGRECGYFRQITKLQDGKLHDSVCFEIMACEFRKGK
ncbi:MAG: GNAT family N-acetyltransferase [Muribaculaceae bacterium]|nr:GNAT family N-acetyltransferase [Muribaculaceae bacterium]